MFSLDSDNPRWRSWLRTAQYAALTFLVLAGTLILVLAGQGYDFDRKSGEVIQNGLLITDTRPDNAQVTINGHAESDLTPGQFALPGGSYEVGLGLEGYRPWSKQIEIAPQSIERLEYPLLIPIQLDPTPVTAWHNLTFISQSFNPNRILVRQTSKQPTFRLVELNGESVVADTAIELPDDVATGTIGTFSVVEWSADSRYVLLAHKSGKRLEYIRLDTEQPGESLNLNTRFDTSLQTAKLIDGDPNRFYAISEQGLSQFTVSTTTISPPLADSIVAYEILRDSEVIILNQENKQLQLSAVAADGTKRVLETNLPNDSKTYKISTGQYDGQTYSALLDGGGGITKLWRNPQNEGQQVPYQTWDSKGASDISFSQGGQFVMSQGGGKFAGYDLDRERTHGFKNPIEHANQPATWLDGYRMLGYNTNNRLYVFEFDGANAQPLVPADPKLGQFFAADLNGMYSVAPADKNENSFLHFTPLLLDN